MKPKPYNLLDYSDVSSKRNSLGTKRSMMPLGGPGGVAPSQQDVLKNFGDYLGVGNSLVNQNQHLFQAQPTQPEQENRPFQGFGQPPEPNSSNMSPLMQGSPY